jgi:hypothetical protein
MRLGLDDGSNSGLSLGWTLNDGMELGVELGETSVGPPLGI